MKKFLTVCTVAAGVLYFALSMSKAKHPGFRILPYETFLFHDMVPILSDVN